MISFRNARSCIKEALSTIVHAQTSKKARIAGELAPQIKGILDPQIAQQIALRNEEIEKIGKLFDGLNADYFQRSDELMKQIKKLQ